MAPNGHNNLESVCPHARGMAKRARGLPWRWAAPAAGLISLAWFLIRVIPKPSRAAYPCQRMAAPLASGFILWVMSLAGSVVALGQARGFWKRARAVPAVLCLAAGLTLLVQSDRPAEPTLAAAFVPADGPNQPMGTAVGARPGRVVWVHDPDATSWDGVTGYSWDSCDKVVVARMVSNALRWLAASSTDAQAWDALFRNLNVRCGRGNVGYVVGEKIAIKANLLAHGSQGPDTSYIVIQAMLDQLINIAGVRPADITVYDASRYMKQSYVNALTANGTRYAGVHLVDNTGEATGTTKVATSATSLVYFGNPNVAKGINVYLPTCVVQAKYLINMAVLKPHVLAGASLGAKNHFGSVCRNSAWSPSFMHPHILRLYGQYSALVELMGHGHLGGKTVLYFLDGLYSPVTDQTGSPQRWRSAPFNNDWCSSVLVSQDPVAIESVALDILRAESAVQTIDVLSGDVDNYLHEAALANDPPSGSLYNSNVADPTTSFGSLGVHEHWNSNAQKLYSRNLGTGSGIELIRQAPSAPPGGGPADFNGDGTVDGDDLLVWRAHFPMLAGANRADGDADGDGDVDGKDFLMWQWLFVP